jgi:hypothetical protein
VSTGNGANPAASDFLVVESAATERSSPMLIRQLVPSMSRSGIPACQHTRLKKTNGSYAVPDGTFQGKASGCTILFEAGPMITTASRTNNGPTGLIHRFRKRDSCVFHSIHRF